MASNRKNCKSFIQSRCTKGNQCQFLHNRSTKTTTNTPCRFYKRNICNKGANCNFLHDDIKNNVNNKQIDTSSWDVSLSGTRIESMCNICHQPYTYLSENKNDTKIEICCTCNKNYCICTCTVCNIKHYVQYPYVCNNYGELQKQCHLFNTQLLCDDHKHSWDADSKGANLVANTCNICHTKYTYPEQHKNETTMEMCKPCNKRYSIGSCEICFESYYKCDSFDWNHWGRQVKLIESNLCDDHKELRKKNIDQALVNYDSNREEDDDDTNQDSSKYDDTTDGDRILKVYYKRRRFYHGGYCSGPEDVKSYTKTTMRIFHVSSSDQVLQGYEVHQEIDIYDSELLHVFWVG